MCLQGGIRNMTWLVVFLEMQCAITTVLRMKEISKFRDKAINSFTDNDLAFAEEFMECLKPLKTVTTSLCTESMPTISVIMPIQHTLLHKMTVMGLTDEKYNCSGFAAQI